MPTYRITVAYDGTNYVGWQRQLNGISVQQLLEDAFIPLVGFAPTVAAAGRTDAGVHARGQVASVSLDVSYPASAVQRALNMRLPADIRVIGAVDARPGFHARSHATGKSYRYRCATTIVEASRTRRSRRLRNAHGLAGTMRRTTLRVTRATQGLRSVGNESHDGHGGPQRWPSAPATRQRQA